MNKLLKTVIIISSLLMWGFPFMQAQNHGNPGENQNHYKDPEPTYNSPNGPGVIMPGKVKAAQFFDTIRTLSSKRKWIYELHNVVILPPQKKITDTVHTTQRDLDFAPYEGLIIRNIRFVKVNVFGATLNDTSSLANTWIQNKGNSIHVKTSTRVLERHLLFRSGDPIDPRVLADNERVLRDLSYIEDARIIVEPVPLMVGFADIVIVEKDQWSKAFYVELSDLNAGRLEVWDRNILGSGNEIQNNIYWNSDKAETWGYEAIYNNRNIYGSFIDGRVFFSNVFNNDAYGLQFNRKFYSPDTRYAGGASLLHHNTLQNIWSIDSGFYSQRISSNVSDIWVGRAIKLNKNATIDKNRLNLILASRLYKQNFFDRPVVKEHEFYAFQDKTVWLNTLALSSQAFYQSNLIYSYGRTEDIPTGTLVNITMGPEFSEFQNRFYTSYGLAKGKYINDLGYLYVKAEHGGFITKSGNFEQAIFQFQVRYFSNLFIFGQFKFRQFISFSLTKGVKRFADDRLTINDKHGLRGFNEENVLGQQRFVMNWETVAFSPLYVLGFRFTFFGYMDFAILGPETTQLIYEDVYSGFGFGTRIKNERLVFPTFTFRLGFYPNLPDLPLDERFKFMGEPRFRPVNFYQTNPAMIEFQ